MPARIVGYSIAALIGALGLLFVLGWQGETTRLVVGGVLAAAAIGIVFVIRSRPTVIEHKITQQVDVAAPFELAHMKCQQCAAALDASALRVENGVPVVVCPHCKASYQLTEAPKW